MSCAPSLLKLSLMLVQTTSHALIVTPSGSSSSTVSAAQSSRCFRPSDAINWMMQVAWHLRLQSESVYLGLSYLDRLALATDSSVRTNLCCVAACLWVAAKFTDVAAPRAANLAHLSGHAFTVDELIDMEAFVLKALDYKLAATTTLEDCLDQILLQLRPAIAAMPAVANLAYYLGEISLLEDQLRLHVPVPQLAATCCFMAWALLGQNPPAKQLQAITGCSLASIQGPAQLLVSVHSTLSIAHQQSGHAYFVTRKYLLPEHGSVAAIPAFWGCEDSRLRKAEPAAAAGVASAVSGATGLQGAQA